MVAHLTFFLGGPSNGIKRVGVGATCSEGGKSGSILPSCPITFFLIRGLLRHIHPVFVLFAMFFCSNKNEVF